MTVIIALLSTAPGAIWAGAISPRISTTTVDRHIQIPDYTHYERETYQNFVIQNVNGAFTNVPSDVVGLLLNSAQRASNLDAPDGIESSHAKLDNTGYTFYGRNYGAGSTVGLSSIPSTLLPLSYYYNETGIVASTLCRRNTTSTFRIVYNASSDLGGGFGATTAYTAGTFSNGDPVEPSWLFGGTLSDLFAIERNWTPDSRRAEVVVASGAATMNSPEFPDSAFARYNQMQCEVTFTSHTIRVNVNTASRAITTDVLNEIEWPAYADAVVSLASSALTDLTYTDNGFAGSLVGKAMLSNTNTLYYSKHGVFPVDVGPDLSDGLLSQSTSDFVTNVFENMLTILGACQKELLNLTQLTGGEFNLIQLTPVEVTVPSVVFGHAGFGYAVFIMSISVTLACAYFIIAKRAWNHVAELDFTDISDVALNTSKVGPHFSTVTTKDVTSVKPISSWRMLLQRGQALLVQIEWTRLFEAAQYCRNLYLISLPYRQSC